MARAKQVIVTGSFDDLALRHVRFLEEAAKEGKLHVQLWPDDAVRQIEGLTPRFPEEERRYLVEASRYVRSVELLKGPVDPDTIAGIEHLKPDVWAVDSMSDTPARRHFCGAHGLEYRVVPTDLKVGAGQPLADACREGDRDRLLRKRKRVIVTGCFDWLHSGHVRFFEEVAQLGDLYVVVGHDANVRLLKGPPHPMFSEEERRYMVQSIRHVARALVSTGHGWMDAEPEIAGIQPDIYAVNEDGDVPEKREFCQEHGIEYAVLKRIPKSGLPERKSTELRGF